MFSLRHGDVIIEQIADDAPRGAQIPRDARGHVLLVAGKTTGHGHRITSPNVDLFEGTSADDERVLVVREVAELSHEEHATRAIPVGTYSVRIKRQYDPEGGWLPVED